MAKGVHHLGVGVGYIYLVASDGTSIKHAIFNDKAGAVEVMRTVSGSYTIPGGTKPVGKVLFESVGSGTLDTLTVNGLAQITGTVTLTSGEEEDAAKLTAENINSTNASTVNVVARAVGKTVYLFASDIESSSAFKDLNEVTVASTSTGSHTITDFDFNEGALPEEFYAGNSGYRVYIDGDYGSKGYLSGGTATQDSISNAAEITKYVIPKAMNHSIAKESDVISSDALDVDRRSSITYVIADTEGSAGTDDLDAINPETFIDCDIVILQGTNQSRVITVKDAIGNIYLNSDFGDFSTLRPRDMLVLQYVNGSFYEINRSHTATVDVGDATDYRDAEYPLGSQGVTTTTITADSRSLELTPNTSNIYQIIDSGANVTLGDDFIITIKTVDTDDNPAKVGDLFLIKVAIDLTDDSKFVYIDGLKLEQEQIENDASILVRCYFNGTSWDKTVLSTNQDGTHSTLYSDFYIKDLAITKDKLESDARQANIGLEVSGETGELGEYKIKVPYAGTLDSVVSHITKQYDQNVVVAVAINGKVVYTGHSLASADAIATKTTSTVGEAFEANSVLSLISNNQGTIPTIGKAYFNFKIDRE